MTGNDLGLKTRTIEQAKFEYSPLGKVFIKGLNKDDQKDGLFKRLKYIKSKYEEQLKAIEYYGENQLKAIETSRLKSIKPDD